MVELRSAVQLEQKEPGQKNVQYMPGFAGDVINFSVYLKRLCPSSSVHFLSATGNDVLSEQMLAFLSDEGIDTELVARSQDKTVGLYMVHTDDAGERSFTYGRSDSAARQMFQLVNSNLLHEISEDADYFYFSGVTLAILPQSDQDELLALASHLRSQGKTIVFDPNYRPVLWDSAEQANAQISRAYALTDILLSSCEDEQRLFNLNSKQAIASHLAAFNIGEIVITDGPGTIHIFHQGECFHVSPSIPEKIVDTTAAGDAFNAGYINARYKNNNPIEAASLASRLAGKVIGFTGAITPRVNLVGDKVNYSPAHSDSN